MTTIKDLYEWAVKNNVENLPIGLQFQDKYDTYRGGHDPDNNTFTSLFDYDVSATVEESDKGKYVLLD